MPPAKRGGEPSCSTGLPPRKRFRASADDGTTAHAQAPVNEHGVLGDNVDEHSTRGLRDAVSDELFAHSLNKEGESLANLPLFSNNVARNDCVVYALKSSNSRDDEGCTSANQAERKRQEPVGLVTDPGIPPRRLVHSMQDSVLEPLPATRQVDRFLNMFAERTSEIPAALRGNLEPSPTVEPLVKPSAKAPSVQNVRRRPSVSGRRRPTYMKPEMFERPVEGFVCPPAVTTNTVASSNVARSTGLSDAAPLPRIPSASATNSKTKDGGNAATNIVYQDRPYPCTECPRRFATRPQFTKHFKTVHLKEKPFVCPHCGRAFGNKSNMAVHVRTVHLKERKYQCTHCERRFGAKPDLTKHIRAVHLKVREHECQICFSRFGREPELLRHVKSVHNKERPHHCTHCQRRFAHKSSLTKHIRTVHFNERPYICIACDARFSNTSNLSRHVRGVHPEEFAAGYFAKVKADDDSLTADENDSSDADENYEGVSHSSAAASAEVCTPVPANVDKVTTPNSRSSGET